MNLDTLKTTWAAYSTKQKWLAAGGAAALLCALSALGQNGTMGQNPGMRSQGTYNQATPMAYMSQGQAPTGYANQGYTNPGYANPGYNGSGAGYIASAPTGNPYNHPDDTDITSGYEHTNAVNDAAAQNFALYQRDETNVQNVATGEVTNEVSNTYATPAIESGAYVEAPTATADNDN